MSEYTVAVLFFATWIYLILEEFVNYAIGLRYDD